MGRLLLLGPTLYAIPLLPDILNRVQINSRAIITCSRLSASACSRTRVFRSRCDFASDGW